MKIQSIGKILVFGEWKGDKYMKIYCTYCSGDKKNNPYWLSALERYNSERIRKVYSFSVKDKVEFHILSGLFGLIHHQHEIMYYNYLLPINEVEHLSKIVAFQIHNYKISKLIYYTKSIKEDPDIRSYYDTIITACNYARIKFEIRNI